MTTTETKTIADYPAFKIIAPSERKVWQADEVFMLPRQTRHHGVLWSEYMLGSVISYALRSNSCPIEALDRARSLRHELHWAIQLSVCISNPPPPKRTVIGLQWGDHIRFEGRTFELRKAPNDNVSLVEVQA
jgi:hypothetical protein